MENVITALIVITLLLAGGLLMTQRNLAAQEALLLAGQVQETRIEARTRTAINPLQSETKSSGGIVELTVENTGQTKLADFAEWDVIVNYESVQGQVLDWVPYIDEASAEDDNEWSVMGVYLNAANATPEVDDPNIMNPDEDLVLRLQLHPPVKVGTTNLATVVTANGIGVTTVFTR
jgi:archaellum component FlaF (FlaF/FlaG flagellin family)